MASISLPEGDIQDAKKLIRTFPQCPLIRSDAIGDEIEDISEIVIEKWLKNFKTEALLTPWFVATKAILKPPVYFLIMFKKKEPKL
jgi:hypothetical protein